MERTIVQWGLFPHGSALIVLLISPYMSYLNWRTGRSPTLISQAHVSLRKGNALGKLDCDEEALAAYEEAIHLVPQDADYYVGKGEVLDQLKLHKAATEAYEKAARLEEDK